MSFSVRGQNLVPNSGFDTISVFPCDFTGSLQLSAVIAGWSDRGTADFYSTCRISSYHVPDNLSGYEYPHSDSSYVGIVTYYKYLPNCREHIQCMLNSSLEIGREYCFSFYLSLADSIGYACNNFGALFTNALIPQSTIDLTDRSTQVNFHQSLVEKIGWTHLSARFIADSAYRYLTLGNFLDDAHSDTVNVGSVAVTISHGYAYYYIDDVTLTPVNYFSANAGTDTILCSSEQVKIGTPGHSGCVYHWSPEEGLSDTTIAEPIATPSVTIAYILTMTDTNVTTECAVWHTTTDTVVVTVIPSADAGRDYKICEGDSVKIGNTYSVGTAYEWNPQLFLSDYTTAQPFAFPAQTTTYILTTSDSLLSSHCHSTDTVVVEVMPCNDEIFVYPNPNNGNFILEYTLNNSENFQFEIYNVLGQMVFDSTLETTSSKGERVEVHKPLSSGVYLWRVESGKNKIAAGKIVIIN